MKMPLASRSHSTSDIFSCPGSWAGEFCCGGGHTVCCASSLQLPVRQLVPENLTWFSGSPGCGAVLGIPALWEYQPLVMEGSQGAGRELGVCGLPRGLVLGVSVGYLPSGPDM